MIQMSHATAHTIKLNGFFFAIFQIHFIVRWVKRYTLLIAINSYWTEKKFIIDIQFDFDIHKKKEENVSGIAKGLL